MKRFNTQEAAKTICEAIRTEAEATENFVRDVALFLDELPQDLGRGSLNGMKAQLREKCREYLVSQPEPAKDDGE